MGESPVLHMRESHRNALSENANQYKAAQSMLFTYLQHITILKSIMQA